LEQDSDSTGQDGAAKAGGTHLDADGPIGVICSDSFCGGESEEWKDRRGGESDDEQTGYSDPAVSGNRDERGADHNGGQADLQDAVAANPLGDDSLDDATDEEAGPVGGYTYSGRGAVQPSALGEEHVCPQTY
jgi:hypothetical protein